MRACAYTSLAQSIPARGLTWLRPGNCAGSLRTDVPWTHAGLFGAFLAASSLASTIAHAPSDDGRRPADAPRRVHAHHRLAHRAERVGEVQLGHHDPFEHVGGLADDDRVDVAPAEPRVLEGAQGRLADEAGEREVVALRRVLR